MLNLEKIAFVCTIFVNLIVIYDARKLPDLYKTCKRNDPQLLQCTTNEAKRTIKHFCKGIPELGVPAIDPLNIGKANILSESSALQLKQSNGVVSGMCNSIIKKIGVDPITKTGILSFVVDASAVLNVETKGRILVIPLDGTGDISMKLDGFEISVDFNWDIFKGKDNLDYPKITNFSYIFDYKKAVFGFRGLFGANSLLGDVVTNLANENPRLMIDELGRPILNIITKRVVKIINKLFAAVPYDEFLPEN